MANFSLFKDSKEATLARRISMSDCDVELEDLVDCSSFSMAPLLVSADSVVSWLLHSTTEIGVG